MPDRGVFKTGTNGRIMDYALSRFNMVEGQIKTNRVTDPYVLEAMSEVPRDAFVPAAKKGIAYIDDAIEIAPRRYMLEPMVLARMLEAVELTENDIALDIGCTTGYSSALLAKTVATVIALESDEKLAETASETLNTLGIDNVFVVTESLSEGVAKQGPYDVILFNGAIGTDVPDRIKDQLADGGRMVVAHSGNSTMATISVYFRNGNVFSKRDLFEGGVAPLPGFETSTGFSF